MDLENLAPVMDINREDMDIRRSDVSDAFILYNI